MSNYKYKKGDIIVDFAGHGAIVLGINDQEPNTYTVKVFPPNERIRVLSIAYVNNNSLLYTGNDIATLRVLYGI